MARKKKADPKTDQVTDQVDGDKVETAADEVPAPDAIEDAEVIEEIAEQDKEPASEDAAPVDESEETDAADVVAQEAEPDQDPVEAEDEAGAEASSEPTPVATSEPVVIRKGGFVPLLLGGVAAAVIGFGMARFVLPEGWPWPGAKGDATTELSARIDGQDKALSDLRDAIPAATDLSPVETKLSDLGGAVAALKQDLAAANARLDGFDARLTDLEKRPITDGASPAVVAAYEGELKALQAAMAAQRAEIEALAQEAATKEANAEITAQEAMKRAAISRILTALDTGNGFADAAGSLDAVGITLAPALEQVADTGVASQADLLAVFPEAARAALAVARKAEGGSGFGGFLKTQFGARSLEPREGDDADAVLSRAEAAMKEGRTGDAIAEIEALPEEARAEMSDWLSRANARTQALAAAEALAAELN